MRKSLGVRIEESLLVRASEIAEIYGLTTSRFIEMALRVYVGLAEQNGTALITPAQIAEFSKILHGELGKSFTPTEYPPLRAAEIGHEPGKVINPAGAGGAAIAQKVTYRTGTKAK